MWKICNIENGKAVKKEIAVAPEHAPGVFPKFIAEQKVNVVITGGMGQRAIDMLKANGTEVILGASGKIEDILKTYLEGNLVVHITIMITMRSITASTNIIIWNIQKIK